VTLVVIAVYLTSLICRSNLSRYRQSSFWTAIFACFAAAIMLILASERDALFTGRSWHENSMGSPTQGFLIYLIFSLAISIIPTLGVVFLYRKKMKK
jgi:hypothetical protein